MSMSDACSTMEVAQFGDKKKVVNDRGLLNPQMVLCHL